VANAAAGSQPADFGISATSGPALSLKIARIPACPDLGVRLVLVLTNIEKNHVVVGRLTHRQQGHAETG